MSKDQDIIFQKWAGEISKVSEFLDTTIKDKEQDFLDLGQNLHEISSRSSSLSSRSDELMGLTSGEKIIETQQSLQDELSDITEYCDVSWGERSTSLLSSVLDLSRSLSLEMNDFKKIVRTLNVLSFTTRIESARLGDIGRGFMTLADDVESLGRKMVKHWQRIVDESSTLYDLVLSARGRVEVLVQDQKVSVEHVLEDLNSNVSDLNSIRESSDQASRLLSEKAENTASHVREMVSSMQFHDITRQIVEHVQHTLDEVLNLIRDNSKEDFQQTQATRKQLAGWINRVCNLQIHQMSQAGKSFFDAVEDLRSGLGSIADNIEAMMNDLKKSLGMGDDEQDNLLSNIGDKISHVKTSIQRFNSQSSEIGEIMQTVGGSVSQMSSFVNDIEEVGSEIELIALNASVRAAHTGSQGMALGVVAVAIQQLSGRARDKTGSVTGILNNISNDAEELQELTARAVDFSGFESLSNKIDKTLSELGNLNQEIEEKLETIFSQGSDLAKTTQFLAGNLDFHHEVLKGMEDARYLLETIVKETETEFETSFDNVQWPENLKKMFERYTMESQRLVHKVGLEGESLDESSSSEDEFWGDGENQEVQQEQDEDYLGDNIELF
ncbi:MAG: methyl-accepting chemotaxis protein [Desulfonatronovibrio sp.]